MRLQLFKHKLPKELIAQHPPKSKYEARLMVVHRDTGQIEHKMFQELANYFNEGDIIIANDSYKTNNLLYGMKEDTEIIVHLLKSVDDYGLAWDAIVSPSRKIRNGNSIYFPALDMECYVKDNTSIRGRVLEFNSEDIIKKFPGVNEDNIKEKFFDIIQKNALLETPEYINHDLTEEDIRFLKSEYAKYPTSRDFVSSGLNFTEKQLLELQLKKISFETLTYAITNFPENKFKTKTVSSGNRIPEFCKINYDLIDKINTAMENNKKICAVGYSSALGIENSFSKALGKMQKDKEIVSKILVSQSDFGVCNALLTNFHKNGSMFLVVDSAFCGIELLDKAYKEAIKEKYRFFIFGDSLLII
ncbi:MAG: S-adenosylmethionine:tRNA ribosyltransferase-isomerase [Cytophagales bacterium]|nr:S-adenosylmethionine:tRNA ribosyltransferase-isomerase [Cytophagales bacterium]